MKILLINQFFWPDSSATSQLLTDLARHLVTSGHEVTVICSDKGYIAPAKNSASDAAANTLDDAQPVKILRVKSLRFVRGNLGRVLSYLSFYLSAAWSGLTIAKQDAVLTLTTPPLLPLLGTLMKHIRGSRHFIWEMDMYPDVAVDLAYFKAGGLLDKTVGILADYARRNSNGILALGECMADRLIQRGIPVNQIWIAHNWADGQAITPQPRPGNSAKLVFLYSGNIGLAHEFDTVLESIEQLKDDPRFEFIFRGSGARLSELSAFKERTAIESIKLSSFVPRSTLSDSLAAGDIGLVTQREICCGSVVPSKIYGLLAAGRPILFIGPDDATPARIIDRFQCGWHIRPGQAHELTVLLSHLAVNRHEVTEAGHHARQALVNHFDITHGLARITSILEESSLATNHFTYASALSVKNPQLVN